MLAATNRALERQLAPSPANPAPPKLTIYSTKPPIGGVESTGMYCARWLVFASGRTTFTGAELQQMADFFARGMYAQPPPDNLLKFTPAGVTDDPRAYAPRFIGWQRELGCAIALQITNTDSSTVQIPQVGLQLTRAAEPNSTQYRLPDACSMQGLSTYCGPNLGGGPVSCDVYTAQVELPVSGGAGASALAAPAAIASDRVSKCPPITLAPGQSVEVIVEARAAEPSVYSLQPVLVVTTGAGSTTVAAPDLAGIMPFASASQFTCYHRDGQALSPTWNGLDALDFTARGGGGAFCP
jgi:hypothetical protein